MAERVRLPRILTTLVAGAAPGITGAALQGMFRTPLVGPQIIGAQTVAACAGCFGVQAVAAFGGALAIFLFGTVFALVSLAFLFSLASLGIVFALARVGGQAPVLTSVLAGAVVTAFFWELYA